VKHRSVITGFAAVIPGGVVRGTLGSRLGSGRPLWGRSRFSPESAEYWMALGSDFDPDQYLDPVVTRRMDPLSVRALVSARLALEDSGMDVPPQASPDPATGIAWGTAFGCQTTTLRFAQKLVEKGGNFPNPIDFPDSIDGAPAAHVAMECALGGPSITVPDGELAGEMALLSASCTLGAGRAERMVVVAGDQLTPALMDLLVHLGVVGVDDASSWTRPDPDPGFRLIPSEVMAAIVLEDAAFAERRHARVYARLTGFGVAVEPRSGRVAYPRQAATHLRAMDQALLQAELDRDQLGVFSGASAGIPELDRVESAAVRAWSREGGRPERVSLRRLLGYCPSDGVLRLGAAALVVGAGVKSPVFRAASADPCARDEPCSVVLHQGVARGGQCMSLVLRAP
jgi:3-oxoacyl-(acyl-carrier-protein) synthase